jgi:hypothetical protein
MMYSVIGKIVVRALTYLVRNRYRTQLRFAAGFGIAALLIGGYLASRGEVAEG